MGLAAQERRSADPRLRRAAPASAPARGGGCALRARAPHQGFGGLRLADGFRPRLGAREDPGRSAPRGRLARALGPAARRLRAAGVRVLRRRRRGGGDRVRRRGRAAAHDRRDRDPLPGDGLDLARRGGLPGARPRALLAGSPLARRDPARRRPGLARRDHAARPPARGGLVDRRGRRLGARVADLPVPQPDRRSLPLLHAAGSDRRGLALARLRAAARFPCDARGSPSPRCWPSSLRSDPPSGRASGATRCCCCWTPRDTTPTAPRPII